MLALPGTKTSKNPWVFFHQQWCPLLFQTPPLSFQTPPLSHKVGALWQPLFRHLPCSARVNQYVGCVCVLLYTSYFLCFSLPSGGLPALHFPQPAKLKKACGDTLLAPLVSCLLPPTLGEWVVWSPPTLPQGHQH